MPVLRQDSVRRPGKIEQLKTLLADTKSLSTPDQNQQINDLVEPSGRNQIDDPHDGDSRADIFQVFADALPASPHIAFLGNELRAVALLDAELAFRDMTHHVVGHGWIGRLGAWLVNDVPHRNTLVARDHRLALAPALATHALRSLRERWRC